MTPVVRLQDGHLPIMYGGDIGPWRYRPDRVLGCQLEQDEGAFRTVPGQMVAARSAAANSPAATSVLTWPSRV